MVRNELYGRLIKVMEEKKRMTGKDIARVCGVSLPTAYSLMEDYVIGCNGRIVKEGRRKYIEAWAEE